MVDLRVHLGDLPLDNPVIPASGTFGFGREFAELYDIRKLGSISFKGTTLNPRFGNPCPRIAETSSGMLNAVGLQNPGVEEVIRTEIPYLAEHFGKWVIANVSGFSIEEYEKTTARLAAEELVGIIEVNISCPNVKGGGISFGTDKKLAAQVTKAVRKQTDKPIYIKLSPNVTDIAEMARAVEDAGADGISMINTFMGMRIDIKRRKPVLHNISGGLSGPAIFPLALRMVWNVFQAVKIPIIGMGGTSSAEDVIEMLLAGASAVQVGAANLVDPWACEKIIDRLPVLCNDLGIEKLEDIIGGANR